MRIGDPVRSHLTIFAEKCSCCVLRVPKKRQLHIERFFTPNDSSPFFSKMAVRHPTPKVNLSESILGPAKIPGLGDIRITHPDVTTDFDWPEMVPRRGGFHKTVASVNGCLKRWRRIIVLASLHRRRRSCAHPPIATGQSSDGTRLSFGQQRVARAIHFQR